MQTLAECSLLLINRNSVVWNLKHDVDCLFVDCLFVYEQTTSSWVKNLFLHVYFMVTKQGEMVDISAWTNNNFKINHHDQWSSSHVYVIVSLQSEWWWTWQCKVCSRLHASRNQSLRKKRSFSYFHLIEMYSGLNIIRTHFALLFKIWFWCAMGNQLLKCTLILVVTQFRGEDHYLTHAVLLCKWKIFGITKHHQKRSPNSPRLQYLMKFCWRIELVWTLQRPKCSYFHFWHFVQQQIWPMPQLPAARSIEDRWWQTIQNGH